MAGMYYGFIGTHSTIVFVWPISIILITMIVLWYCVFITIRLYYIHRLSVKHGRASSCCSTYAGSTLSTDCNVAWWWSLTIRNQVIIDTSVTTTTTWGRGKGSTTSTRPHNHTCGAYKILSLIALMHIHAQSLTIIVCMITDCSMCMVYTMCILRPRYNHYN